METREKDWSLLSGQIRQAIYSEDKKTLTVNFKSGGRYEYHDVPLTVWEKSLNAPSIGKFLNTDIKPHYKAVKLN